MYLQPRSQRMGVGMVRLHCPAHYEIVVKASNMVLEDWFQLFLIKEYYFLSCGFFFFTKRLKESFIVVE